MEEVEPTGPAVPFLKLADEIQSAAWEAGMRHALAWLGLKQYGDVMAKDNPHGRVGE